MAPAAYGPNPQSTAGRQKSLTDGGDWQLSHLQPSMPPVQDITDICICEIPATTHSQGQCLDLYSVLQIHVGFHSNAPMV